MDKITPLSQPSKDKMTENTQYKMSLSVNTEKPKINQKEEGNDPFLTKAKDQLHLVPKIRCENDTGKSLPATLL